MISKSLKIMQRALMNVENFIIVAATEILEMIMMIFCIIYIFVLVMIGIIATRKRKGK